MFEDVIYFFLNKVFNVMVKNDFRHLPSIALNCNFRQAIRIFCFEFKLLSYPGKGTEKRVVVNVSEIG